MSKDRAAAAAAGILSIVRAHLPRAKLGELVAMRTEIEAALRDELDAAAQQARDDTKPSD